jgi:hypothetical protein
MFVIVGIPANPAIINSYVAHEKRSVARTGTFASNTTVASTGWMGHADGFLYSVRHRL